MTRRSTVPKKSAGTLAGTPSETLWQCNEHQVWVKSPHPCAFCFYEEWGFLPTKREGVEASSPSVDAIVLKMLQGDLPEGLLPEG